MKILILDIETAPNSGYFWGLFKQNISINHLLETSRVLCFSAKWHGTRGKPEFWSEFENGSVEMLNRAWELLDEADVVLTFNGERFDLPVLNKEFIQAGMLPPLPYKSIDLYKVSKRRFRFTSHKLDHIARELGVTPKVKHEGFELWVKCMDSDPAAWRRMKRYNIGDVRTLAEVYEAMLPWIDNHPNFALYQDGPAERPTCTNCGSTDVIKRGTQPTKTQVYQRYQCKSCGTPLRGRYTLVPKNSNVLVGIGP